ncbi:cytochrome c-550 PedF [Methylobacterium sp. J-076]|uniref:cytochrome c-550 PedF n=1 Tax=Methylobacterium sp. J-076 TaxID=2836655 RepID=UPI001FB9A6E1|nr:cytochrome c-550 PedF [Methylobacterium sp. J-076]MCJ2012863.1 cytochrome c-550 PedF [Methylobacterium sp. J-076]
MSRRLALAGSVLAALVVSSGAVFGHGDVQPQPVNTDGLPSLGETWRDENPYRDNATAVKIGSSAYNQNCARCHGLQVISGGIAPDLRYLEKGKEGDEWFKERVTHGAIIDGMTKMPVFAGVISQEGLWAIRSYIESQHVDN